MKTNEKNKEELQKELMVLKLKTIHSVEDKHRIQTLQQLLFNNQ
jgi:hypothetical protein